MRRALILAALAACAGCGARSGLELERLDAGARPDASSLDARALDAFSPDAAPDCRVDGDCDDGLACSDDRCVAGECEHRYQSERCNDGVFCNGLERCEPVMGCVSPGRVCDDGTACTVDACDEARDRCVAEPEDTLCPLSFRCDVSRGCLARALVHDATNLFEIDLPSGELRMIGAFPISLTDIALAPDGTFYGASAELGLVRVDYRSVTYELDTPVSGSFNALDIAPDGTIFGAADDVIYIFDRAAARARVIARFPTGRISAGDLGFVEGRLYATATPVSVSRDGDELYEVDLATGGTRLVGTVGFECVWALAPLGTRLYGLTCEGRLLELDLTTGRGAQLSQRPGQAYWGAASR